MLAPLTNKGRSAHKLGQLNEKNIRVVLGVVMEGLRELVECGLVYRKDKIHLATSIDGFVVFCNLNEHWFHCERFCNLEVKDKDSTTEKDEVSEDETNSGSLKCKETALGEFEDMSESENSDDEDGSDYENDSNFLDVINSPFGAALEIKTVTSRKTRKQARLARDTQGIFHTAILVI